MVATLNLRAELWLWFGARARQHPQEHLTRLPDLTIKRLGSASDPKLKLKGAECCAFFLFILAMLRKYATRLGNDGANLLKAGEHMEQILIKMRALRGTPVELVDRQDISYICAAVSRRPRQILLLVQHQRPDATAAQRITPPTPITPDPQARYQCLATLPTTPRQQKQQH